MSELLYRLMMKGVTSGVILPSVRAFIDNSQVGVGEKDACARAGFFVVELLAGAEQKEISEIVIVGLDIKNAFGSVARDAILRAAESLGLPANIVKLLKSSFDREQLFYND